MTFKPLLAGKAPADLSALRFPVLASAKLDGIRCVKLNGRALSRNLKPIPNRYAREWIEANLPDGLDGELMLRDMGLPFCAVTSAIMSEDGTPDFVYACFDWLPQDEHDLQRAEDAPFQTRLGNLHHFETGADMATRKHFAVVPHAVVRTVEELQGLAALHLAQGFEGSMIRSPEGRYKFGRSTEREGILLKVKQFEDDEATVVGVKEEQENQNTATVDNLGRTKRSTAKDGKVGKGRLGALVCKMADGTEVDIGSGFTEAQRIELWKDVETVQSMQRYDFTGMTDAVKPEVIGRLVKFKHQPPPGGRARGEAPRFPVFLGFRHEADA